MAGDEHRDLPLPVECQNELAHFDDALWVEPIDRFVEHQKIRIAAQRNGDAQALFHAKGEVAGLLFARVPKADQRQQLVDARKGGQSQNAVLLQEVFARRHVEVDGGRLDHSAHSPAHLCDDGVLAAHAVEGIVARGGVLKAADQPDQGCFAGAVFSNEAVDGALWNVKGEPVERLEIAIVLAQSVCLKYIFHMNPPLLHVTMP